MPIFPAISEKEQNRRAQARADMLGFFHHCIMELEDLLRMGLNRDDAVSSALLEYGWDLIPAQNEE